MESFEINIFRLGIVAVVLILSTVFYNGNQIGMEYEDERLLPNDEIDSNMRLMPSVSVSHGDSQERGMSLGSPLIGIFHGQDDYSNKRMLDVPNLHELQGSRSSIDAVSTLDISQSSVDISEFDATSLSSTKGLLIGPWPKGSSNNNNTGRSAHYGDLTGNLIWKYKAGSYTSGLFRASPVIDADGSIIIGGQDNVMYAISRYGALKWTFTSDGSIQESAAIAQDGTIYFGTYAGSFYALNSTGGLLWKFPKSGSYIVSSPAIGKDGTVYYGAADLDTKVGQDNTGSLYALNPLDGSIKWRCILISPILTSSPALGADGMLYIGSYDYSLHAINSSGVEVWAAKTAGYVRSAPVLAVRKGVSTIYLTSFFGVYAFYHNGITRWMFNTTALISSSPAVGTDGTVFITSRDYYLYAVNPDTGLLKWKYKTGWTVFTTPSIGADNTVYFGSSDTYFYAINGFTGKVLWKRVTEGAQQVRSSAAIGADNGVYVGLQSGWVVAYRQYAPTSQPTAQPSSSPTSRPTSQPSGVPTTQPSNRPESAPSSQPSSSPTCIGGHIYLNRDQEASSLEYINEGSPILVSRCGECSVGTYSNSKGASYCTVCPQGSFASSTGATKCAECPYPHTNRKVGVINIYLQSPSQSDDNENAQGYFAGERRTKCDAINLNINRRAMFALLGFICAVIVAALSFIHLTAPELLGVRGIDGMKNSIIGLLLVLPNIELCSYVYLLCTVTVIYQYYLAMWFFLALHTALFVCFVFAAYRKEKHHTPTPRRSSTYNHIEYMRSISRKSVDSTNSLMAVRKKRLLESSDVGDEKMQDDKIPTLSDIYPNQEGQTVMGSNVKVPITLAPVSVVSVFGRTGGKGSIKSNASGNSRGSMSSRISRGSYQSNLTGDSRSYLIKASRLPPLTFKFNLIVSHILWLRVEGRYATYGGRKFPCSPKKHNTFLLFSVEILVWCVAILLQIATIFLLPLLLVLFYPVWFLFGALLFLLRILPYRCVWQTWFTVWKNMTPNFDIFHICSGKEDNDESKMSSNSASDFSSSRGDDLICDPIIKRTLSMDLRSAEEIQVELHNLLMGVSPLGGLFFQTIPIIIFVVLNCEATNDWSMEAYISLFCAGVMLVVGPVCFMVYYYMSHYGEDNERKGKPEVENSSNDESGGDYLGVCEGPQPLSSDTIDDNRLPDRRPSTTSNQHSLL